MYGKEQKQFEIGKLFKRWSESSLQEVRPIHSAFDLAKKILQSRYTSDGILAGETHFSDTWIRDCCFAGWGSLAINDTEVINSEGQW